MHRFPVSFLLYEITFSLCVCVCVCVYLRQMVQKMHYLVTLNTIDRIEFFVCYPLKVEISGSVLVVGPTITPCDDAIHTLVSGPSVQCSKNFLILERYC